MLIRGGCRSTSLLRDPWHMSTNVTIEVDERTADVLQDVRADGISQQHDEK